MKFLNNVMLLAFSIATLNACNAQTAEKASTTPVEEIKKGVPVMAFDKDSHDFGKVTKGENVSHTFKFTNKGDVPLTIELVSGCDCTDLDWPEGKTFQPGESGEIKATFVSAREEESGQLERTIDILLENIDPETGYQIFEELKFYLVLEEK